MNRYCPNCQSKLWFSDHYFCSVCGTPLDTVNINSTVPLKERVHYEHAKSILMSDVFGLEEFRASLKRLHMKSFVESGVFVTLLAIFFILYTNLFSQKIEESFTLLFRNSDPASNIQLSDRDANSLRTGRVLFIYPFSKINNDDYLSYVPSNSELYVEVTDYKAFNSYFKSLSSPLINSLNTYAPYFEQHFVMSSKLYDEKPSYVFYLTPNQDMTSTVLSDLQESEFSYKVASLGKKIILYSSDEAFQDVKNAYSGTAMNMEKNPQMVISNSRLKSDGWIKVITLNKTGIEILKNFVRETPNSPANEFIGKMIGSGKDQFVLY